MTLRHPLSLQIYSGRKFPPLAAQFEIAARHGFTNIETFGGVHEDLAETRRLLDRNRLIARSAHVAIDVIETDLPRALEIARALDLEYVVAPYLAPDARPKDAAGWIALGERLARCRDALAAHKLRFAWHNHDFEFAVLPDGSYPIEHLLRDGVDWEADLAWVVRGKADPRVWIQRYRGRIPLVHVKDIAPAGENASEDGWADVGAGVLPWADLWMRAVEAGAEIMVAEHDNPGDFDRFARVSAGVMRKLANGETK